MAYPLPDNGQDTSYYGYNSDLLPSWGGGSPGNGPSPSMAEQRVTDALLSASDQVSVARPPLFPPRWGYRQEAYGLYDVLDVNTVLPTAEHDFYDQADSFRGSPTNSLGSI